MHIGWTPALLHFRRGMVLPISSLICFKRFSIPAMLPVRALWSCAKKSLCRRQVETNDVQHSGLVVGSGAVVGCWLSSPPKAPSFWNRGRGSPGSPAPLGGNRHATLQCIATHAFRNNSMSRIQSRHWAQAERKQV